MTISGAATATGGRRTKQDLSKKKQPLLQSEETDRSASLTWNLPFNYKLWDFLQSCKTKIECSTSVKHTFVK